MIRVVCREPSHADRPYPVGAFARGEVGGEFEWVDVVRRTGHVVEGPDVQDVQDIHLRFRLDCRRCGLCVEATDERINPVLDRLEAHGQAEVTLRALAAILN